MKPQTYRSPTSHSSIIKPVLQAGFTLIEIAIVIVIIALLSGGIMKGLELIEDSRIQKTTEQIQSLGATWYTYLNRFKQFPGDDNSADSNFGTSATNGDGNGQLSTAEQPNVWKHLNAAKILTTGAGEPLLTVWGHKYRFSYNTTKKIHQICIVNLEADRALIIDSLLDDGKPKTGRVTSENTSLIRYSGQNVTICNQL